MKKLISKFSNLTLNNVFDFGYDDRIYEIKMTDHINVNLNNELINTNLISAFMYDIDNNVYDSKYTKMFELNYYFCKNYLKLCMNSFKINYKIILYKSSQFAEFYDILNVFDYIITNCEELHNISNDDIDADFLIVCFSKKNIIKDKLDIYKIFNERNININKIKLLC